MPRPQLKETSRVQPIQEVTSLTTTLTPQNQLRLAFVFQWEKKFKMQKNSQNFFLLSHPHFFYYNLILTNFSSFFTTSTQKKK